MHDLALIGFDIALLIIAVVLVPSSLKVIKILNDILDGTKLFTTSLSALCESIKTITSELTEARIRDVNLRNDINSLRERIDSHCDKS